MTGIRPRDYVLMTLTLAFGLAADVYTGFAGQMAISAAVWAVLFYLMARLAPKDRASVMACLVIATAGEMALSLGWGLYTYRLDNIPQFIPPGHVLMLMLGIGLARRMPESVATGIIGAAGLYALFSTLRGFDTLACVLMIVLLGLAYRFPRQRRLYASTFVLALALELYGTWLGNWTWALEVPGIGWTTINPPPLAGVFYAALDALVLGAIVLLGRGSRVEPAATTMMEPAGRST
ncbi:MAG: hypothetical protein ACXW12_17145 [Burkholderiales bacterium]